MQCWHSTQVLCSPKPDGLAKDASQLAQCEGLVLATSPECCACDAQAVGHNAAGELMQLKSSGDENIFTYIRYSHVKGDQS